MLIKDHHLQLLNDVWKQRESEDERLRGGGDDDDISCFLPTKCLDILIFYERKKVIVALSYAFS